MKLTVPVPDGLMTGETYTVSITLSLGTSQSNVKTRKQWTSQDGSQSWSANEWQMVEDLVLSSTKNVGQEKEMTSTQLSHYGCWCNSSKKRDTND